MMEEEKLRGYLNQVTAKLRQTRQRLREMRERDSEPVAIVAMSCRYPGGAGSPEELWELVAAGADAISEFPQDRAWGVDDPHDSDADPAEASYAAAGRFVSDVAGFDAGVFRIRP